MTRPTVDQMSRSTQDPPASLADGGEMGERMRSLDWSATPLGSPAAWPQSLKTAVGVMLNSRYPMFLAWGPDLAFLYNDGYAPILGKKHPQALGRRFADVWAEIWDDILPLIERSLAGKATWSENLPLFMHRHGYTEETYYTFSYSPVHDETGGVGGMFCACIETTDNVLSERRFALLREVSAATPEARTRHDACLCAARALGANAQDIPFAIISLAGPDGLLRTVAAAGFDGPAPPTLAELTLSPDVRVIDNLAEIVGRSVPSGPWKKAPERAAVLPIHASDARGALVVGLNPFRSFDNAYRRFLTLVAAQIAAGIANAGAFEDEKKRTDALAEIDRAKTAFFSNASHELRTPLMLMLGPLQAALASTPALPTGVAVDLEVAERNALRLLKLVNSLLDFSRIEAGRIQASYEPTDLASFTADLAGSFRCSVERAGMRLVIDCPPLAEPVYIDREMWEKIVLNLLSNAFKYTFAGEIRVQLAPADGGVALSVSDTGVGIPEEAIPRLFERFFRVEGAVGRTTEGTGIGLALVAELVRLHAGRVRAASRLGEGSTFIVSIPFGSAHLPQERIRSQASTAPGNIRAFVDEAAAWTTGTAFGGDGLEQRDDAHPRRPTVVIADDNGDMRAYIERILSAGHRVISTSNGAEALEIIRRRRPDLVVTDVMMPGLDGFGLLKAIRSDHALSTLPVIVLSARAGEEARIDGLGRGADDYLIKPFSARELLAKASAQIQLARVRTEALSILRQRDEFLSGVLGSITDGFYALDKDWRFTFVNDELVRRVGQPRSELLGRNIWSVFPAAADTPAYPHLHRAMAERISVEYQLFYEPLGRWLQDRAYPTADGGLSVYTQDITDAKRNEEELARQRRLYEGVLTTTPDLAYIFDLDHRFIYANEGLLRMWGKTWDQAIGRTCLELGYEKWHAEMHDREIEQVIATKQPLRGEVPFTGAFGRRIYDYIFTPVIGSDGNVEAIAGMTRDISELVRNGEELRLHRDHLQQLVDARTAELESSHKQLRIAERLAAMGTLAAGLGHDMGNLLVPMRVRLESLATVGLDGPHKQDVATVQSCTEYLRRLALGLRLLAIDPHRAPKSQCTHVHHWWYEVEPLLRSVLPRSVALQSRIADRPLRAPISSAALTQAVLNLVQNCGEALKERGDGSVTVWAEERAGQTLIGVADDGPGMTPDVKARCMEPFFSTKTADKSGGMGLALVHTLVQQAGGVVLLESAPGQGTTFTLVFPTPSDVPYTPPPQAPPHAPPHASPQPSPQRRALVRIREPRLRAFVSAELRALSFTVDNEAGAPPLPPTAPPTGSPADLIVTDDAANANAAPAPHRILIGEAVSPGDGLIVLGDKPPIGAIQSALRAAAARASSRP